MLGLLEMKNEDDSFLDFIEQDELDKIIEIVSRQLFDEWMGSNLDDGIFWADYRFAELSNDKTIKNKFNNHWDIKKGEEYYL